MKKIKKQELDLNKQKEAYKKMVAQNLDKAVIEAQKQVVDKLEQSIQVNKAELKDMEVKLEIVDYDKLEKKTVSKKLAKLKYNRPIDMDKVDTFTTIITHGKYEKAAAIITCEASLLLEKGYKVETWEGKEIAQEDAGAYLVILDGQHRVCAWLKWLSVHTDDAIPSVHIKAEMDKVEEYLVDINMVGNWTPKDKAVVAALVNKNDEFLQAVAGAINMGIATSTASKIFCKEKISSNTMTKALKGEKYKLPKNADLNIERGWRFINTCRASGIPVYYISKRTLIDDFNSYCAATNDEQAFEGLAKLKDKAKLSDELKKVNAENKFITLLKGGSLLDE